MTLTREPDALSGLICAFHLGEADLRRLREAEASVPPRTGWIWAHYRLGDVRAQAAIRQGYDLPADALELFRADEDRIQINQSDGWIFGILPDLQRDLASNPRDEGRLIFAFDSQRLITARLHPLCAVDDLRLAVEGGTPLESPSAALAELVTFYLERMEGLLDDLSDQLSGVEDYILTEPQSPTDTKLSRIRRAVSRHRRELQALRGALGRANSVRPGRRIEPVADGFGDVMAWVEDLDREAAALQERGRLLHEEVDTLINGATNRSMRVLTIISTLLIPPTLIVGAFGMNVSGVPFEKGGGGFFWASGLCVAVVGAAVWLLRRMDLLR